MHYVEGSRRTLQLPCAGHTYVAAACLPVVSPGLCDDEPRLLTYPLGAAPQAMKEKVVSATLEVYRTVMAQLLPTPTKSHYTFNLRDISRVMQGFLMLRPTKLPAGAAGEEKYVRLWCHEVRGRVSEAQHACMTCEIMQPQWPICCEYSSHCWWYRTTCCATRRDDVGPL
jgi:hypothetical protein